MAFQIGQRVMVETRRRVPSGFYVSQRRGQITDVVRGEPRPRYRVRWDTGEESVFTPRGNELRPEPAPESG